MKTITISDADADQIVRLRKQRNAMSRLRKRRKSKAERERNSEGGDTMRKRNSEPVPMAAPPDPTSWVYIVRKQRNAAGKTFPVGSIITREQCGPNFQAMIDNREIVLARRSAFHPAPRPLPPADPVKMRPPVEPLFGRDPIENFLLTFREHITKCGGDVHAAEDALYRDPRTTDMRPEAAKAWCARERQRRGLISCVPPTTAEWLAMELPS